MTDNVTVARPYARAAFDVAREDGQLKVWSDALAFLAQAVEDERVHALIGSPKLTTERKAEALAGLFAQPASAETRNFLRLLAHNRRLSLLPEIAEGFEALRAEAENTLDVDLVSVIPVADDEQRKLATALRAKLGREIQINNVIDEDLIGGAVVRAGDLVIDGSVRGRLDALAGTLAR